MNELYEQNTDGDRLVEEIMDGTTEGWYSEDGYGDYLSVEGIVAKGTYHPLAITAKLPTVPPYIEVASTSPCVLPERPAAQDRRGLPAGGRRARAGHLRHAHRAQAARGRRTGRDRGRRPVRRPADHPAGRDRLRPGPDRHADPRAARRAGRLPAGDAGRRRPRRGLGRRRTGRRRRYAVADPAAVGPGAGGLVERCCPPAARSNRCRRSCCRPARRCRGSTRPAVRATGWASSSSRRTTPRRCYATAARSSTVSKAPCPARAGTAATPAGTPGGRAVRSDNRSARRCPPP